MSIEYVNFEIVLKIYIFPLKLQVHMTITILFVGDIIGKPGLDMVQTWLPGLEKKYKADIINNSDELKISYAERSKYNSGQRISGAILNAKLDISHPIGYGYRRTDLPIFLSGSQFAETFPTIGRFVNG